MTPAQMLRPFLLLILAIATLFTSIWAWKRYHMPHYQPAAMQEFSTQMRTHCLGRYLIDLPADLGSPKLSLAMLYYGDKTSFKRVEIKAPETENITRENFTSLVAARRLSLESEKNTHLDIPMILAKNIIKTPNGDAYLFRYLENDSKEVSTVMSEVHEWVDGRYVMLLAESFPPDDSYQLEMKKRYLLADPTSAEARLTSLAESLKSSKGGKITDGFCINGVLFDKYAVSYAEEKANFSFSTNKGKQPRLRFSVDMEGKWGYSSPEDTLHARLAHITQAANMEPDKYLMRQVRRKIKKIEGVTFEEWGGEYYEKKGKSFQYEFKMEKPRPAGTLTMERPSISVTLESGQSFTADSPSPYSLDQIEKAWDQWLSTLRLSPGNGGKPR